MDTQQSRPALHVVFAILDAWGLGESEQLAILGLSKEKYIKLRTGQNCLALDVELTERISLIFGIYKRLQVLFPDPEAADTWIHRSNDAPLFKGKAPRDYLLSGEMDAIYMVRRYLDAISSGNF